MDPHAPTASELADRFAAVRRRTIELCAPLTVEDQLVQPMADASPTKWHLAQQHQELILTDLECVLGTQPTRPPCRDDLARGPASAAPVRWRANFFPPAARWQMTGVRLATDA